MIAAGRKRKPRNCADLHREKRILARIQIPARIVYQKSIGEESVIISQVKGMLSYPANFISTKCSRSTHKFVVNVKLGISLGG